MNVNWFVSHCQQEQPGIALLAAGAGSAAERERAESHLAGCAACQAYYQELRAVTADIAGLKLPTAAPAPSRLRSRWTDEILGDARATDKRRSRADWPLAARDGWFSRNRPGLAWALATAACVLAAFGIGYWHGRAGATDPLLNVKLVRETLAMFPNQIRAIVQDEHGMKLILAEHGDVPVSAPLYIRINDGQHCESFLTFSGQDIVVAGQTVTVLADTHGGVILAGDRFLWSETKQAQTTGHWKIEAKNLGPITM
jgi:hypothetical protein